MLKCIYRTKFDSNVLRFVSVLILTESLSNKFFYVQIVPKRYNGNSMLLDSASFRDFWDTPYMNFLKESN